MKYKVTNREAVGKIARREDFANSTGSFTGKDFGAIPPGYRWFGNGWMPEWAERVLSEVGRAYVVVSYDTPIGWFDYRRGTWVMPRVRYSVTTSRHQGWLRQAIGDGPVEYPSYDSANSMTYLKEEWR